DRGLLTADGRQRQPYIEARIVRAGAAAVVVGMPFQPSVPIGQSAHAANIGSQIRQAECSVGLARQQRDQLARQLGRHAAFDIRQPDRPARYQPLSQGRIAAAGVKKSKGVAHDLGDATKILIIEKTAYDGGPVDLKSHAVGPIYASRPAGHGDGSGLELAPTSTVERGQPHGPAFTFTLSHSRTTLG